MSLTSDPKDPRLGHGTDREPGPQDAAYLVLSEAERAKGFARPLRLSYRHVGIPGPRWPLRDLTDAEQERYAGTGYVKYEEYPPDDRPALGRYWTQAQLDSIGQGCGVVTTMAGAIAETYSARPGFYGSHSVRPLPDAPQGRPRRRVYVGRARWIRGGESGGNMKARRPNLRPCGVEGCTNPHNSHGYCQAHGLRFLRYGDPLGNYQRAPLPEFCSVPGCEKPRARVNGLCQMHNWRLAVHGDVNYEPYLPRECAAPICRARSKGYGYCQKHLNRLRKGIPLDAPGKQPARHRYRAVKRPGHPLAMKNGRVYVHRMVLHDTTGGARMPCFWCGKPLEWFRPKLHPEALVVDHRDHDRHNNDPTNLLPACNSCNAGRIKGFAAHRVSVYSPGGEPDGSEAGNRVGT